MAVLRFATVVLILVGVCYPLSSQAVPAGGRVELEWSNNVSAQYPPDNPLVVTPGDKLDITCPPGGISNIWILEYVEQYNQCNCTASGIQIEEGKCDAALAIRQVCQDEALFSITTDSSELQSSLSFIPGTTYYLISFAPLDETLAGYSSNSAGGQCVEGYKMVLQVASLQVETQATTVVTATSTEPSTSTDDKKQVVPSMKPEENKPTQTEVNVGSLVNGESAIISSSVTCLTVIASVLILSLLMA